MLFLQGTADPFARPELVAKVIDALGGGRLEKIEGAATTRSRSEALVPTRTRSVLTLPASPRRSCAE